jgi:diaminopimelate epimerase
VNGASPVIPFVKANACGNDFLLIDAALAPSDINGFTRRICDRHDGVGADGVEWMSPHFAADVGIRLINADGSDAEISGNGTRCVAAYICAESGKEKIAIQTGAGLKLSSLTARRDSEYEFEIEMGKAEVGRELAIKLGAGEVHGIPVALGNPHFVMIERDLADNWQMVAAEVQRSPVFKQGVNVEMVVIENKHDIRAMFFERGVGETRSSGTGSCASAVAAIATGKAESPLRVHAPGGTQTVRQLGNDVFLRGPARLVCRGEFFLA